MADTQYEYGLFRSFGEDEDAVTIQIFQSETDAVNSQTRLDVLKRRTIGEWADYQSPGEPQAKPQSVAASSKK